MNCPSCGSVMKSLWISDYCPNDCDKKALNEPKSIELKWGDKLWKMALIGSNEDCPSWATHRWWVFEPTENLEDLAKAWGYTEGPSDDPYTPGWTIETRSDGARSDLSQSVVFCIILI